MGNTKEFWSLEGLRAFASQTKEEEVLGKMVRIKKLPASVMMQDASKDLFSIISKGLIEPKLNKEELENLPISFTKEIVEKIMAYSSIDMETAEKK